MQFQDSNRKRRPVPQEKYSLGNNYRVPMKLQIVGRYVFLVGTIERRKETAQEISKEITLL